MSDVSTEPVAEPQLTPREVVAEPMAPDQTTPLEALELRCAAAEAREAELLVKLAAYQVREVEAAMEQAQLRLRAVQTALAQKYQLRAQDHVLFDGRIERSKGA